MLHAKTISDVVSNLTLLQVAVAVAVLTVIRLALVSLVGAVVRPEMHRVRLVGRTVIEIADALLYAFAIAFLVIKPLVAQPFFIPTGSMEPTLRGDDSVKDHVWVDKIGYRLHTPRRGDVVVFYPPPQATEGESPSAGAKPTDPWIKRLIGLPGDRIEARAGRVIIDGVPHSHNDVRAALASAGIYGNADEDIVDTQEFLAVHHVKFVRDGVLADGRFITKSEIAVAFGQSPNSDVEIEPGYVKRNGKILDEPYVAEDPDYDLKLIDGLPLKNNYGREDDDQYEIDGQPIGEDEYFEYLKKPAGVVPPNSYFMMGDNRNDSEDSTEWGPLASNRVVGRADVLFWPLNRMTVKL